MDHPLYSLLAAGYFGFGTVSHFLDTYTPIQVTRYCSGWRFWITKRHHHATRQNATAVAPREFYKDVKSVICSLAEGLTAY